MDDHGARARTGTLEGPPDGSERLRLPEDRASRILERAAALDARRSSEIEVEQLREAAAQAGISREAFDEAMAEQVGAATAGEKGGRGTRQPRASAVAHYGSLLADLLGDEAQVVVVEDRIEARDADGVMVSITPSSGEATATVVAEGKLVGRLKAVALPALFPALVAFLILIEEDGLGGGMLLGVLFALIASIVGTVVSHRREKAALKKKVERIRRQLQRMLLAPPEETR